jgi:hypothetical protein
MASFTKITETKRKRRLQKMGAARKRVESARSTPSYGELFAALGEPGQPAPTAAGESK